MLIISPDSQWKSIFDLWVLLFVGYSCIWNVLYFAFPMDETTPSFRAIKLFNQISEGVFYVDFILSFFQAYRHKETFEISPRILSAICFKSTTIQWFLDLPPSNKFHFDKTRREFCENCSTCI